MEIVPGIQRIESILGPRPFSQYLLHGERTLLVDTGVEETPADVILPFLADAGFDPAELDLILNTHADVDHFGGNAAMREAATRALVLRPRARRRVDREPGADPARALRLVRGARHRLRPGDRRLAARRHGA